MKPNPGRHRPRKRWGPAAWYLAIAAFNAVFYMALGAGIVALGVSPPLAGPLALIPVLIVSYLGHKSKTFRSTGAHRREAPRFGLICILDLVLASVVPQLGVHFKAPPGAAFFVLTGLVPLANFLLMRFWIFRDRS